MSRQIKIDSESIIERWFEKLTKQRVEKLTDLALRMYYEIWQIL